MTNLSVQDEIKKLISEGCISEALQKLLKLSKPNKQIHDALILISGEFNELTIQRMNGTIDNKEVTLKRNKIHERILIALNAFDSEGNPLPNASISKGQTTSHLLKLGFIAAILSAVIYFILSFLDNNSGLFYNTLNALSLIMPFSSFFLFAGWLIAMVFRAIKER